MNVLERRYRRLMWLMPRSYRQARGEEMLGTLLDAAVQGQKWPHVGEVFSLVFLSLRLRFGTVDAEGRMTSWGVAVRTAALSWAYFFALDGVVTAFRWMRDPQWQIAFLHYNYTAGTKEKVASFASLALLPMVWLAVFVLLVLNLRRVAAVLAVIAAVAGQVCVRWVAGKSMATVATLVAIAILLSCFQKMPEIKGRRWWFCALAVAAPQLFASGHASRFAVWGSPGLLVAGVALLVALTVDRSPLWPMALAIVGSPFLGDDGWSYGSMFVRGGGYILPSVPIERILVVAAVFAVIRHVVAARRASGSLPTVPARLPEDL